MDVRKRAAAAVSAVAVLGVFFLSCRSQTPDQTGLDLESFSVIEEIAEKKDSPFYVDFSSCPDEKAELPIGVFDSGTGGLTVLDAVLKLDKFNNQDHSYGPDGIPDFQSEKFIFLADSANMPYGRYGVEGKADFLRELIIKNVGFLLGSRYYLHPEEDSFQTSKPPVKAVVIACNTATAYGLDLIRRCFGKWDLDIPVIGIVEAGAKAAAGLIPPDDRNSIIAVFATQGTVDSGGYQRALAGQLRKRGMEETRVVQQAGFGLAAAADGDPAYIDPDAGHVRGDMYQGPSLGHSVYPILPELWEEYHFEPEGLLISRDDAGNIVSVELNSVVNYIRYYVTHLVEKSRRKYPGHILRAAVLGCTHYSFFQDEFKEHFRYLSQLNPGTSGFIAREIHFVDPAESEAEELYLNLVENNSFGSSSNAESEFFVSLPNPRLPQNQIDELGNFPLEYKYGRNVNQSAEFVKRVPLSPQWISPEALERIRLKMPDIYRYIMK